MTELLATIFGVYMICAGLGILIRKGWVMQVIDEMENNVTMTYLAGAMILMLGTALVLTHNIWTGWPEILITLIGWGAAIEGAILLIYPPLLIKISRLMMPSEKIVPLFGIGVIALGGALLFL